MRELGYDEENLAIEFLNVPSPAEYPKAYQELVQRHVNIIIALGPELALKSAIAATSKLPIVMVAIDYDPFALGYVTSLAHPTGNVTGVYFQQIELSAKRLELAKEMMPGLQSAAVFWDSASEDQFQSLKKAGQDLGIAGGCSSAGRSGGSSSSSIMRSHRRGGMLTSSLIPLKSRQKARVCRPSTSCPILLRHGATGF